MEIWFVLALLSALSGGIGAFTHKIIAVRKYDINVLNACASIISALLLGVCTWIFSDFSSFWHTASLVALIGSVLYLVTLILKVRAMEYIDTTIFFPIYKLIGPSLVLLFGISFFAESFTLYEWIGLILSLFVPLLLINKKENIRQNNLRKGLQLTLVAALFGSVSIALFKYATDISLNVWLLLFISDIFLALSSVAVLLRQDSSQVLKKSVISLQHSGWKLIVLMGLMQMIGASTMVFAFAQGGALAMVYAINSLYIVVPVLLSILIYKEHINTKKAVAIFVSVCALALLQ